MLKVQWVMGKTILEATGETSKEVFESLAGAAEIFGHSQCGACGSNDIAPVTRTNSGYKFYQLKCGQCAAELNFGQRREDGDLYPRRKDGDGNYIENNGWAKWAPKGGYDREDRGQRQDDRGSQQGRSQRQDWGKEEQPF